METVALTNPTHRGTVVDAQARVAAQGGGDDKRDGRARAQDAGAHRVKLQQAAVGAKHGKAGQVGDGRAAPRVGHVQCRLVEHHLQAEWLRGRHGGWALAGHQACAAGEGNE